MGQPIDDAAVRTEITKRRQNQWTMVVVVLLGTGLAIVGGLAVGGHVGFGLVAITSVALMLPFWIGWFWYTRRNWRCPACDAPLPGSSGNGYMWRVPVCERCGRALA